MVNRMGQWQQMNPKDWPQRTRVNIKVGLSPAERNRKATSLQNTVQQQMQIFQQGGAQIMVNMNGIHRALLDWSRAVDLDNPEKYWIDPESEASVAAAKSQSEAQAAQKKAELEAITAEATAAEINGDRDFQIDKMKIQLEYFKSIIGAEVDEAKLISDAIEQATAATTQASGANSGNGASVGQAES